jgi:hypothetical protein
MAAAVAALLAFPLLARADDISNNLDATIDTDLEVMTLTAGGANGTTQLRVVTQNDDGKNGCNLTGSTTLVVLVSSSNTAVATVSPSSITFTSCGATPTVTVTPGSAGTAVISLGQTSNNTGGSFNLAPASFTVTVAEAPASDTTAPDISYTLNPAAPDGDNGWYVGNVTLTWTVSEPESSGSLVLIGCVDQNITSDQNATDYSCSATSDGGSAGPVTVAIKRDATLPTISGSASPAANGAGWNNTDVAVAFACADATSGIASCGPDEMLTSEGTGQSVAGTATDNAGNSNSATVSGINIDKTAPVVTVTGVTDGASYYFGSVPAAGCTTGDALSGVATNAMPTGGLGTVGFHTVTCGGALDVAGNSGAASASYTVLAWTLTGFFKPVNMGEDVWNTVKGGSTVPLKFRVFVGEAELTDTSAILSFTTTKMSCTAGESEEPVAVTTTGGTVLRYDTTGQQFIQNWQTPKGAGCYKTTVTTLDGSEISALFKTK